MKENKFLDFVNTFNDNLNENESQNFLQYQSDGYTQSIKIPQIYIIDDEDGSENICQKAAVKIFLLTKKINENALNFLIYQIDDFFEYEENQIKEKFPYIIFRWTFNTIKGVEIFIKGDQADLKFYDLLMKIESDFKSTFQGIDLNIEY